MKALGLMKKGREKHINKIPTRYLPINTYHINKIPTRYLPIKKFKKMDFAELLIYFGEYNKNITQKRPQNVLNRILSFSPKVLGEDSDKNYKK